MCVCVCMYVRMYVCMYVCMWLCVLGSRFRLITIISLRFHKQITYR